MHTKDARKLIDCAEEGCNKIGSKGFTRRDHYIEHMRRTHGKHDEYPKRVKPRR
jgi:hypothetical protein